MIKYFKYICINAYVYINICYIYPSIISSKDKPLSMLNIFVWPDMVYYNTILYCLYNRIIIDFICTLAHSYVSYKNIIYLKIYY